MQNLTIAGTVGKNAILRHTQNNDPILGFSVAVSNGKDKDATWYDCSLFGPRGEKVKDYITKGTRIAITGRPTVRVHEGKPYLGVSVNDFTLLGGGERSEGGSSDGYGSKPKQETKESYDLNDDIPFVRPAFDWEA